MSDEQEYLTVAEVAARWRLRQSRPVWDVIERKQLRATKIGGQWLIKPADVEAFEMSQANVKTTPKRTRLPKRRVA